MHTIMQHGAAIISGLTSLFTLEIVRLTMEDGGLKIGGRGQGSRAGEQEEEAGWKGGQEDVWCLVWQAKTWRIKCQESVCQVYTNLLHGGW